MECRNCHTSLDDKDSFCKSCGAKVIHYRLSMKILFSDFSEQFLNYDNKFFRTLVTLFKNPNNVIGSYINGTRKKYVNVLSYFAIAITISGIQLFILNKFFPEVMDLSTISAKGSEEFSKKNLEFVNEYQSLLMMLYVPIYALIAQLVFYTIKKYNYTELLVIFMYILSQISIVATLITVGCALFGISLGTSAVVLIPLQILYSAYCLKQLYSLSLSGIILRTLLFLLIMVVCLIILSILMAILMYSTNTFDQLIDVQKAAKETTYILSSAINWTS